MTAAKVILDLCGGTGSWSKPYADAGYTVIIVDPSTSVGDVRWLQHTPCYGILAAPPCTHFSVSGAQYWNEKDYDGRTLHDLSIVDACMRIIMVSKPTFWALENPVGRLKRWLGPPQLIFNPCDYGDPYTKRTLLWGNFNTPIQNPVTPIRSCKQGSWIQKLGGKSAKTKRLRSVTPPGFAKAFFDANR